MNTDDMFPLVLKDDTNTYLFDRLGVCLRTVSLGLGDCRIEVISLCGSLDLDLTESGVIQDLMNKPRKVALEQFVKWAAASPWYRNILADVDFGNFRKSDLFHKINTEFIIPTQLVAGQIYSTAEACAFAFSKEKIFISYIEHQVDKKGFQRADVYGEMPEHHEFFLRHLPIGKQSQASEVVRIICEAFREGYAYKPDWPCILLSGADETIKKPRSASELLKYAAYVGFRGSKYYPENDEDYSE